MGCATASSRSWSPPAATFAKSLSGPATTAWPSPSPAMAVYSRTAPTQPSIVSIPSSARCELGLTRRAEPSAVVVATQRLESRSRSFPACDRLGKTVGGTRNGPCCAQLTRFGNRFEPFNSGPTSMLHGSGSRAAGPEGWTVVRDARNPTVVRDARNPTLVRSTTSSRPSCGARQ